MPLSDGLGLCVACPGCGEALALSAEVTASLEPGDVLACPALGCRAGLVVTQAGGSRLVLRVRGPVLACPGCGKALELPAEMLTAQPGGMVSLGACCPLCGVAIAIQAG